MMMPRRVLLRMVLMSGGFAASSVPIRSRERVQGSTAAAPLELFVADDDGAARLVLRDGAGEVVSIAVPPRVVPASLDAAVANALWHPNGRDVALGVTGGRESFVVVFLEGADGGYAAVDVSRVERTNIGGIGPNRTYPIRRTRPVEWLPDRRLEGGRYEGRAAVTLRFRTELRDQEGRRYAGTDALIITRDGTPLWR